MLEARQKRLHITGYHSYEHLELTHENRLQNSGFLWGILTGKRQSKAFRVVINFSILIGSSHTHEKLHWVEHLGLVHFALCKCCCTSVLKRKEEENGGGREEKKEGELYVLLWYNNVIFRIHCQAKKQNRTIFITWYLLSKNGGRKIEIWFFIKKQLMSKSKMNKLLLMGKE